MAEDRSDRFKELEDMYDGYQVNDRDGEKIGKVDDMFVDEDDRTEYIGVKMGFLGLSGTTLIPMEICRVDEGDNTITVEAEQDRVKNGPNFDDDEAITPDFERQVRDHYGLESLGDDDRGSYGGYDSDDEHHPGVAMGDTDDGEFREHPVGEEGPNEPESDLEDEDELRVQRTEEELRAGTREREAGKVNVRKRVRTDREEVRVPKRREEVSVERVPVDEDKGERTAAESEIGEDDVSVPVVEDEVVVEKKPVAKEEIRIRKDVVEDEEVVEEDVRKEEVEVDDDSKK
ncbi:MAG: DUF2382 domain-containing protein [Rubrobacteraceae bacterium]